jgi:threonylcarbamoyladenosine tRNA methylthiotransferase MtaB
LLKVVLPLRVHIFPFSIRYGTPACKCKDKIATAVIKERINRLKDITKEFSLKYRKQFLGKTMAVLFEARDKKDRWFWQGHTANYLIVLLKTQRNLNNQIINARLRKLQGDSIIADFS